jgi:predicted nicotinamide N-methyase
MPTRDAAPRRLPRSHRRAFVQRHTRLQEVDGVPGLRLHLADEVEPVWHAVEEALGAGDAPIPFWAFAWAGGLALARWVHEHPDAVAGRTVLDLATGSGLVAIVAARAGAIHVLAADIDPFAEAAVELNAREARVHVAFVGHDLLDGAPPESDVVLAGDTWYEAALADRVLPWLEAAAHGGARVLIGDPGRAYVPDVAEAGLRELAAYEVRTTTTLEDQPVVTGRVFELVAVAR